MGVRVIRYTRPAMRVEERASPRGSVCALARDSGLVGLLGRSGLLAAFPCHWIPDLVVVG